MTTTATKERGIIVRGRDKGMGGAFEPPQHPMHTMSVQTELRRRPENRGSMSLEYAATFEYLDDNTRNQAKRILAEYTPPAFETPEVQEWVLQVMRHFRSCYERGGKVHVLEPDEALPPVEEHSGVVRVRRFYPDYQPDPELVKDTRKHVSPEDARAKYRERIEAEHTKATRNADAERAYRLRLLGLGLRLAIIENAILYHHTGRVCFGWREPMEARDVSEVLDVISEFQWPYDIKRKGEPPLSGE